NFLRRRHEALEHQLGVGRQRDAGVAPLDHLDRPAETAAGEVVFRDVGAGRRRPHRAQHRRLADADHHRAMLATLPVFPPDDVAVLAVLDEDRERVLVMYLDAVGADIDPVAVGIAGDDEALGADVAAAVVLMPFRRREGIDVDRAAFDHIAQRGPVLDHDRRDRIGLLAAMLAIDLHAVEADLAIVEHFRGSHVHHHAMAGRIALDIAEDQDRRRVLFEAQLIERADLEIGVGAVDIFDVPHLLGEFERLAQIAQSFEHDGFAIADRFVHRLFLPCSDEAGPVMMTDLGFLSRRPLDPFAATAGLASAPARLAAAITRPMSPCWSRVRIMASRHSSAGCARTALAHRRNLARMSSRAESRDTACTSTVTVRLPSSETVMVSGLTAGTWRIFFITALTRGSCMASSASSSSVKRPQTSAAAIRKAPLKPALSSSHGSGRNSENVCRSAAIDSTLSARTACSSTRRKAASISGWPGLQAG